MKLSKKLLTKLIKEQIQESDDYYNKMMSIAKDIKGKKPAQPKMDYVFYKDGKIAFYLINVFHDMREGDSLKSELVSQLPAHDKYKIFGPSPAVMTKADTRRDGASDRIISADTLALGEHPDYHNR